jgi:hypothetical protein
VIKVVKRGLTNIKNLVIHISHIYGAALSLLSFYIILYEFSINVR